MNFEYDDMGWEPEELHYKNNISLVFNGDKEKKLPKLYLSGLITKQDFEKIKKLNIFYVIDYYCYEFVHQNTEDIKFMNIPLQDSSSFCLDKEKHLVPTLNFINDAHDHNSDVLLHCQYGRSRSPAMIIWIMIDVLNMTFDDAYNEVYKYRKELDINLGFILQLTELGAQYSLEVEEDQELNSV